MRNKLYASLNRCPAFISTVFPFLQQPGLDSLEKPYVDAACLGKVFLSKRLGSRLSTVIIEVAFEEQRTLLSFLASQVHLNA